MQADLILLSDAVIPVAPVAFLGPGYVAIAGGCILAVGPRGAEVAHLGPATQVIDYGERPIMPGFVDAHCHLEVAARMLFKHVDVRTPGCRTVADVLDRLRSAIPSMLFDGWLLAQANLFFDQKLADRRFPT